MLVVGPRAIRWGAGAAAALLLLAALGTAAVSYVAADRLIHPPREHRSTTPADRGLAYEPATLVTEDGLRLWAWWIPAEGDAQGTVVFLHGYGASKASQSLAVAPFLHRAGYHVLAFDFRAHGESEGDHTTIGIEEAADVRAAVAYAIARGGSELPIALFGWSMGAAAALNAGPTLPPQVKAVVVDSGFAKLANVVSNNLEGFTGLPRYPFEPLIMLFASDMAGHAAGENEPAREAGLLQRPLLVIQGAKDTIARPDGDGQEIATSAGIWASFWLVPAAGHVEARRAQPRAYEENVVAFLREAFA